MGTSMSPGEIEEFLAGQRTIVVTTLRRDGSPVAHPLWFVTLGTSVCVDTRTNSLKHKNILNDPRVCAVVESGETYFELRGVRIEGHCQPVTDREEIDRVQAAIEEKDSRLGSGTAEMPDWFSKSRAQRRNRGDRVILRISMERVYSWDFSKAREHYESAASAAHANDADEGAKRG